MTPSTHTPTLIGQTFRVQHGHHVVVMQVHKVVLGHALCRSLDLRWTGRWPVDRVREALAENCG